MEGAVSEVREHVAADRRTDMPMGERELDAYLTRAVKRTAIMRQGFYVVVLLVALAGQVTGAVEAFDIPLALALPAVGALELGGIVVMANADVRRRLGERAIASRVLSAAIAGGAVAFNWLAHSDHLLGGFFAGMSALGYLVWLMHTENARRDRLRAKGTLPPTTPAYELAGHWLRHPVLTMRAKSLARANPGLGLYGSLSAAKAEIRRERRQSAISKVLHRKIRSSVDPATADIAVAVYDLDEIAKRLADGADYDGLTKLIAADLAPARLAPDAVPDEPKPAVTATATVDEVLSSVEPRAVGDWRDLPPLAVDAATQHNTAQPGPARHTTRAVPGETVDGETVAAGAMHAKPVHAKPVQAETVHAKPVQAETVRPRTPDDTVDAEEVDTGEVVPTPRSPLPPALLRDIDQLLPRRSDTQELPRVTPKPTVAAKAATAGKVTASVPAPRSRAASLRTRVHTTLDTRIPGSDKMPDTELIDLVADLLQLTDVERLTATNYVQSWRRDVENGKRTVPAAG